MAVASPEATWKRTYSEPISRSKRWALACPSGSAMSAAITLSNSLPMCFTSSRRMLGFARLTWAEWIRGAECSRP